MAENYRIFWLRPEAALWTIVWENGADLASEFLYGNMKIGISASRP